MAATSGTTRTTRGAGPAANCVALDRPGPSEPELAPEVVEPGGVLPGEFLVLAAEVAVGGGSPVDGTAQVEGFDDGRRAEVEDLVDGRLDPRRIDGLGAEGLHHDGD